MRMNLAMAGVDHEPFVIRLDNELFQQRLPNALIAPAAEAPVGVFPTPVGSGQIPPWRARAKNPEHGIDELAVILCDPTPNPGASR